MDPVTSRKKITEEIILACKEGGCPWDYRNAPLYRSQDRYGRTIWVRRVRCRDCGSLKFRKYEPRLPLVPITRSWDYDRPPGWYDIRVYWSKALDRRILRGQIELPDGQVTSASE